MEVVYMHVRFVRRVFMVGWYVFCDPITMKMLFPLHFKMMMNLKYHIHVLPEILICRMVHQETA